MTSCPRLPWKKVSPSYHLSAADVCLSRLITQAGQPALQQLQLHLLPPDVRAWSRATLGRQLRQAPAARDTALFSLGRPEPQGQAPDPRAVQVL